MNQNQTPSASYKLTLKADSGYKNEQTGRISVDQYTAVCGILGGKVAPEVVLNADAQKSQVDWLQKVNTLHRQVEILYVVDGYHVTVAWDGEPISEDFHGETVAEAIDKAMAGFDLGPDARHPFQVRELDPHERQMAALTAQRDELLAALEGLLSSADRLYDTSTAGLTESSEVARAAIAAAKGGAQ